jgi:glutamyl-tRNA synthetase
MQKVREELANLSEWSPAAIHAAMQNTGEKLGIGLGKIGPALRVAITGTQQSPSIDHTVYLAGRDEALKRIDVALDMLSKQA